jgi:hypothetical protein
VPADAPSLQVGADVQVQFHDRDAVGCEHALEASDALDIAANQSGRAPGLAHGGRQEIPVPAGMQDDDPSLRGDHAPVAPKLRSLAFDLVRVAEPVHGDELRIEPAEQLVDDLAAARAGDSRHDHRNRPCPRLAQFELRVEQPVLQLRQLVLVFELGEPPAAQRLVEHLRSACAPPQPRRAAPDRPAPAA